MADNNNVLTQQILDTCSKNAAIAAQTALEEARKAISGGLLGGDTIHQAGGGNHQSAAETLSASIGKEVFARCLNGQSMNFSSQKGR